MPNVNPVKSKSVGIKDVAEYLGISIATVSCVLSGQVRKHVANNTALRVREAARELGYTPKYQAHNMKNKQTKTISILFHNFQRCQPAQIMRGINNVFDQHNCKANIYLCDHTSEAKNLTEDIIQRDIHSILKYHYAGIICIPTPNMQSVYGKFIHSKIPLVFIGDSANGSLARLQGPSFVTWDSESAARTMMKYLIKTGRCRIAFAGACYGSSSKVPQYRAYEKILMEMSLPLKKEWILHRKHPYSPTPQKIRDIFIGNSEKPDAFFAINNTVATDLIDELDDIGVRIPEDVAVVGMGDSPSSHYRGINLTTIHEPIEKIGCEAAEVLLKLIEISEHRPIHRRVICNKLEIGQTT